MTFPTLVSEVSSSQPTNTTTHTVSMAGSLVATNLLVSAVLFDSLPARTGQIPDNWFVALNTSDTGDNAGLYVYWRTADAAEGASQTITTDVAQCSAHHSWQFAGQSAGTILEAAVFQGPSAGTSADPPSLNPANWGTEDTLWIALVGADNGAITVTGFPTSYTNTGQQGADSSADGVVLGWGLRANATAAEDPSAFTLSGSTTYCTAIIGIRPAAPVEFIAMGAKSAGGTTTVGIDYPTGVAAGRLAVAGRSAYQNAVTTSTESGWSNHTDLLGGLVGTNSADSHQTRVALDTKELAGSESGTVTFDQAGTANGAVGIMGMYAKSPSSTTWDIATTTGDDATHAANRSVTGSGTVSLQPGDVVTAVVAVDTDTSLTITSPAITASGITFGTTTRRTSGAGVATGNDGNIEWFEATVTAGTGTVAPVLAFTTATSQCGPVAFARLRAVSSSVTGTVAVTQADQTSTATGVGPFSGTVAVTQAAQTGTATGQLGYSGTTATTQAAQSVAASGQLGYAGTSATPSAAQTSAAAGTALPPFSGSVAVTQAAQVSTAAGQLGYSGTTAVTQAAQTPVASGQLGYSATSTTTQAAQTSAAAGTVTASGVAGSLAVTQAAQTGSAAGQLGYSGTVAATQAAQASAASGQLGYAGTANITAANQTSTATGQLGHTGTAAATQQAQTAAATGTVTPPVTGTVAVTQADQTTAATGQLGYTATASALQADQTAIAVGLFIGATTGTAALTQADQFALGAGISARPGEVIVLPVEAIYDELFGATHSDSPGAVHRDPAPGFQEPAAVTFREQT